MGTATGFGATYKDVVLDIDSELVFWRDNLHASAFHRTDRDFLEYVPTLKFGYDMYLLHHDEALETLVAHSRQRYARSVCEHDRLDWTLAEAVIRETWKRMRPESSLRIPGLAYRQYSIAPSPRSMVSV